MTRNQRNHLIFVILIFSLSIGACSLLDAPSAAQPASKAVIETKMPTSTINPDTPPLEKTVTLAPTWTPLPTLTGDEALELVEELYATNAGCRLPCWWGITPGETTWEEARQFYETFTTEIIRGDSNQITERGVTYAETRYIVRFALGGEFHVAAQGLYVIENVISMINFGRLSLEYTIELHELLAEYGPPTHIYMSTFANSPFSFLPFTLAVVYKDQGILAIYIYDNAERVGDQIQSCPMPVGTVLWLWSQIIEMDYADIEFRALGPDPNQPLRLLEDVTDYTIESFYQTFKDPSNNTCIETAVEYWE